MVDQNLIEYVKSHLEQGFSIEEIRQSLLSQHLSPQEVEEAINTAKSYEYGGPAKPAIGIDEPQIKRKVVPYGVKLGLGLLVVFIIIFLLIFYLFINANPTRSLISISEYSLFEGVLLEEVAVDSQINFTLDGEIYEIIVEEVKSDYVILGGDIETEMDIGDENLFDLDNDGVDDLLVSLKEIVDFQATLYLVKPEAVFYCTEDWNCTGWSPCINETMQRVCVDLSGCGTEYNKPSTEMNCTEEIANYSVGNESNYSEEEFNCSISSNFASSGIFISVGENLTIDAQGYSNEDMVEWSIENETIASLNSSLGGFIFLEGLEIGNTTILVIDGSIGNYCNFTIDLEVT